MSETTKPESVLKKESSQTAKDPQEQAADNSYHIKTSGTEPEMALLPGGLFVMSIPMQAKGMGRAAAMGWAVMALFKLHETYNNLEELAEKHRPKIMKPQPGMVDRIKAAASGLIRPS